MNLSTANTTNQQYSANLFTDTSAPGAHNPNVLPNNTTSNVSAINASKMIGGLPFLHNGGKRKTINRRKIKKISSKYKMRSSRKQIRRIKSRLLRKSRRTRSNRGTKRRRSRAMKGGQYMSNVATNASYSTGGPLAAADSAMANPVPFASNDVNSFDKYNHFP